MCTSAIWRSRRPTSFGMTLPIVKHSYLVMDVNELPRIMKEAFHLARSGRPGAHRHRHPQGRPAGEEFQPVFPAAVEFRNPILSEEHRADDDTLRKVSSPLLPRRAGHHAEEAGHLRRQRRASSRPRPTRNCGLSRKTNIQVATTLMGVGIFPENEQALDAVVRHARRGLRQPGPVDECDLLLDRPARGLTTASPATRASSRPARRSCTSTSTHPSTTRTSA